MSGEVSRLPAPDGEGRGPVRGRGGSSLISVLWGLTGTLIGVVLGAAGMGDNLVVRFMAPDTQHQREVVEWSARLDEIRRDLTARERELGEERHQRKEAVAALRGVIEAAERSAQASARQGELLSGLLVHQRGGSEASRQRLVEVVCRLRADAGGGGMTVENAPLAFGADEISKAGPWDGLMAQLGVSGDLLARARRNPSSVAVPAVTPYNVFEVQRAMQIRRSIMREAHEATTAINRHLGTVKIARAVKLADGGEHVIPRDIALAMLSRADCRGA